MLQTLGALQCSHKASKRPSLLFPCSFAASGPCDTDGNEEVGLDEWISCLVDGSETWYRISHQQQIPQTFCCQGSGINNPCWDPWVRQAHGASVHRVDLLYIHFIISQPEGGKITWLMSYLNTSQLLGCQKHKPQGTKELLSSQETKCSLGM